MKQAATYGIMLFLCWSVVATVRTIALGEVKAQRPANNNAARRPTASDMVEEFNKQPAADNSNPSEGEAPIVEPDAQTQEYRAAEIDYATFVLTFTRQSYEWQLLSSRIIFYVVISLVLAGVYFSGVQFYKGLNREVSEVTKLEASAKGIAVSSSVLGVIILVISFMFFYLYLAYVYPIHRNNSPSAVSGKVASKRLEPSNAKQ
jgi:hypothetical protein